MDIAVPRSRGGRGGLQGFSSGHSSTACGGTEQVDIPAGGGLQDFLLIRSLA